MTGGAAWQVQGSPLDHSLADDHVLSGSAPRTNGGGRFGAGSRDVSSTAELRVVAWCSSATAVGAYDTRTKQIDPEGVIISFVIVMAGEFAAVRPARAWSMAERCGRTRSRGPRSRRATSARPHRRARPVGTPRACRRTTVPTAPSCSSSSAARPELSGAQASSEVAGRNARDDPRTPKAGRDPREGADWPRRDRSDGVRRDLRGRAGRRPVEFAAVAAIGPARCSAPRGLTRLCFGHPPLGGRCPARSWPTPGSRSATQHPAERPRVATRRPATRHGCSTRTTVTPRCGN